MFIVMLLMMMMMMMMTPTTMVTMNKVRLDNCNDVDIDVTSMMMLAALTTAMM